ncbi:MAG: acetyl/propionyl/methylcrotonyl-CoA carboxylase subunit alpha [Albidovulum sp.]
MFAKILIANRGEVACRVIDTCRRMGVATVAVYSDADRSARHVAMADEAVHIGASAPKDSYLRGDVIIQAALDTGAAAIHPGYGFLSENPGFVDATRAAGLIFIGPSAAAIRAMGLKDAAKKLMEQAGVPVVPGYHGANQDAKHLADAANTIGYPVLIKAVAGGGGKGLRLVEKPADFAGALTSAMGEAQTAFGNPAVLVEKYVEKPRHIEVQIFGDGTSAVHLYERDCSLQRRHQKVIEEAPAPGMTEDMRAAMGDAAVRAAMAIGYAGAGTVEFITDASEGLRPGRFWFMEMNTRLQVEHPVTEAITGIDLVEWQLRVASGESLPLAQEDIRITGHAFEARLYAEDAGAGFLPATGTLSHLNFPANVRAETGVRTGDKISPWYDPMIAKIIAHGPTRAIALAKLQAALAATEVAGTITNLDFLAALARHKGFAKGDVDTGLIGRDLAGLLATDPTPLPIRALAAIHAAGLGADPQPFEGFSLWQPARHQITLEEFSAQIEALGAGRYRVFIGDKDILCEQRGDWWVNGEKLHSNVVCDGDRVSVFAGRGYHFTKRDPLARSVAAANAALTLSPMPGMVKAVFVAVGQVVGAGERLAVLEAMKMEHVLCAGYAGTVAEVLVSSGDQVVAGAALIRLDEEERP